MRSLFQKKKKKKGGGKTPICTEVPSSSRYSTAKINMFSFSLEMQMVSKCLIVYLVTHSQASMSPSPLLLSPEHENMRSGLPSKVDQTLQSALEGRGSRRRGSPPSSSAPPALGPSCRPHPLSDRNSWG